MRILLLLGLVLVVPPIARAEDSPTAYAGAEENTLAQESSFEDDPADPSSEPASDEEKPPLDLTLHRKPTSAAPGDAWWGGVRVQAKLDTTQLYLDGEFIGEGTGLRDHVAPGVHILEARLASGRQMVASVFVRPGAVVDYAVHIGDAEGDQAYAVLMNIASILAMTAIGSATATEGNQPIRTDMPGLMTPTDALKSGNRQVERP